MKILAIVPARGGSKRLPNKNGRYFGGKPLLVWSIECIEGIPEICNVLVSTDDSKLASISEAAGALVPWLRPTHLASDTATSVDVVLHALEWYEKEIGKVDGVLLLQPTSPLRRREEILEGIRLFIDNGFRPVIGVSRAKSHPMWCFQVERNVLKPIVEGRGLNDRSQDLPEAYVVNGSFYLVSPAFLKKERSFFGDEMVPLVIAEPEASIDIDTELDWQYAEVVLKSLHRYSVK